MIMRVKIGILVSVLLLMLTGCRAEHRQIRTWMHTPSPEKTGAANVRDEDAMKEGTIRENATDGNITNEGVAKEAKQEYDAMLEPYWGLSDTQSLISDLDGDGIPEMVLIEPKMVQVAYEGQMMDSMRYVYSVYTYGDHGVRTLIDKRVTKSAQAGGSSLVVGVDQVDGNPVIIAMSIGETTGVDFGDAGYESRINVEAVDPFRDVIVSELYQEIQGKHVVCQAPGNFSGELSRFSEMKLDENGILSFSPAVIAESMKAKDNGNIENGTDNSTSNGNTESTPDGEHADDATKLSTIADLEKLRNNSNGHFVLTQDISLGSGFKPFGEFNGTLDGQGHWLRGLWLNVDGQTTDGLFASFGKDAVVKNLLVEVNATVTETLPTQISGLVGSNNGRIFGCTVQSYITGGTEYSPIAYYNGGEVEYCLAETTVKNVERVNGFICENTGDLRGCSTEINAVGCSLIRGLLYRNYGNAIEDCVVIATGEDVATFVCTASQNYAPIRDCVFLARLMPPAEQNLTWDIGDDNGYFETSNEVEVLEITRTGDTYAGAGTQSDPYRLREAQDLDMLRYEPKAYFRLENDIDFSGSVFSPLGEFGGVLDGNGHTIRGVSFSFAAGVNNKAAALIRNLLKTGVVENLVLECAMDAGKLERTDGSGIAVCNEGTIRNCSVTVQAANCYAFGGITRNNTATGRIENCTANITTDECKFVGGIAEYQSGTVTGCSADVQVVDATCMGGIAYGNGGAIRSCNATGYVRTSYGSGYLAGLVGENLQSGTVTASKASVSNGVTGKMLPHIGNQ